VLALVVTVFAAGTALQDKPVKSDADDIAGLFNMIPPVAPSILSSNPEFAKIHTHLTTNVLGPDASTKANSARHGKTEQQVKSREVYEAEADILRRNLSYISLKSTSVTDQGSEETPLPHELLDLVLVIATYLSESRLLNLSSEAHKFMTPEVGLFKSRLPDAIAPALSCRVIQERDSLRHLAGLTNQTSTGSQAISSKASSAQCLPLYATLSSRRANLSENQTRTYPAAQTNLVNTLADLLTKASTHHSQLINALESTSYGPVSRHTATRSSHLATVAEGMAAKMQVLLLQARLGIYGGSDPARRARVQSALKNYLAHLRSLVSGGGDLKRREAALQVALREYDTPDLERLRGVAKRYAALFGEIKIVKAEIARLQEEGRTRGDERRRGGRIR